MSKPHSNNWYVITGGPSTGKTTLLEGLKAAGYKTIPEAARSFIDQQIKNGMSVAAIRKNERLFQKNILKLKQTIESGLNPTDTIFFDRGIHDTLAYFMYYDWKIDAGLKEAVATARYKAVFLLDALPQYQTDYARTENIDFTERLNTILFDVYAKQGIKVIRIPVLEPKARIDRLLYLTSKQ